MRNRIAALATAAVLATGTTLALGSTPAMAAFNDCPAGEVCWWANANYQGAWGHRTAANISSVGCWSMGASGNTASSYRSRLSAPWHGVIFHDGGGAYCYGNTATIGTAMYGNFVDLAPQYDDNWLGGIGVW